MPRSRRVPYVELIYFPGCPHVELARDRIRAALDAAGLEGIWRERDASAPDAPEHVRGWGSPTVLVDGRDVQGGQRGEGLSCRVYSAGQGAPPLAAIVEALRARSSPGAPG